MDYLVKDQYGEVFVVENHQITKVDCSLERYLNHLLELRLSSLQATLKSVKRNLNIAHLTPLYINQKTLLFPLSGRRSKETIYLNFHQIDQIETHHQHQAIISFKNNHQMILSSRKTLYRGLTKCEKIIDYLNEINSK
ncbi:MAG: competence protein ComK [Candidatus Izemoplasmatales bacterium]